MIMGFPPEGVDSAFSGVALAISTSGWFRAIDRSAVPASIRLGFATSLVWAAVCQPRHRSFVFTLTAGSLWCPVSMIFFSDLSAGRTFGHYAAPRLI